MKKIVGVQSAKKEAISQEELKQLLQEGFANIDKITEKPKLADLYAAVDDIWAKGLTKQLIFKNKDQHMQYVTTYYKDQIEPLTLDQYKGMLKQNLQSQVTNLLNALDQQKQAEAYKLHKEHEEKVLKNMEYQVQDLKERNAQVDSDIKKEIGNA